MNKSFKKKKASIKWNYMYKKKELKSLNAKKKNGGNKDE